MALAGMALPASVPSTCHLHDFPEFNSQSPKKKGPPTELHIAALFLQFHPSVPGSVSAGGAFFRSRSCSRERREFQRGVHSAVGSPDKLNRRPNCGPPASDPLAKCLGLGCVDSDHGRLDSWLATVCFGHVERA